MLKIGDFSKLSRVSVRMLRYYDEIGLLKPAEIDRFTDYRYYSEAQLPTVCRITALRDMGFGLADVCAILPIYDVTIKTLPERYAATVRMTIPRYQDEGMVWQALCRETDSMHLLPTDPCYCCVVFLDGEYKEKDVTVEAQKTVKGPYPDTEHVRFRTLPPVTYAGCTFKGGYEQINDVTAALTAWIEANGYEYAGPMFDIYHVSPHETSDPSEFVTEVCYPVRKK